MCFTAATYFFYSCGFHSYTPACRYGICVSAFTLPMHLCVRCPRTCFRTQVTWLKVLSNCIPPLQPVCLLMVSCRHPYCNSLCDLVWRKRNALQEDDLKRHSCYRLQMCILKGEKVFAFIFLSAVLSTIKYFCHTMDLTVLWMADK